VLRSRHWPETNQPAVHYRSMVISGFLFGVMLALVVGERRQLR
jgi:hypothetical protein